MPLKIAVLGTAHGHINVYLAQWKQHPEWDVQATKVWDHDEARLQEFSKNQQLEAVSDVDALLADPAIQAVVICAETSLHAELVEKAAAAGKAIAVQKPMATTLKDADRIVAAVNAHKVPFTMLWQMRVDPQNLQMRDWMRSGKLGQLFQFRRRHALNMCLNPGFATAWHVIPKWNRDIWADDSAHPIDLIHWLFGMPESVTAEIVSLNHNGMPNDNGIAIFRYPGGPLVEVTCSFTCTGAEISTEIYGSKGSVQQYYGDAISCSLPRDEAAVGLKLWDAEARTWIAGDAPSPHSQAERLANLAKPMAEFFHGNGPAICTAEDGRDSLRMVMATYVSTMEGRRVAMDDPAIDKVPDPV